MSVTGTPGTGTITLNAAISGYQTFAASGVSSGDTVSYLIRDGANWEIGRGTYTSSGVTLSRDTILFSTNSNAAISASSSAIVSAICAGEDLSLLPDLLLQVVNQIVPANCSVSVCYIYEISNEIFLEIGSNGMIDIT